MPECIWPYWNMSLKREILNCTISLHQVMKKVFLVSIFFNYFYYFLFLSNKSKNMHTTVDCWTFQNFKTFSFCNNLRNYVIYDWALKKNDVCIAYVVTFLCTFDWKLCSVRHCHSFLLYVKQRFAFAKKGLHKIFKRLTPSRTSLLLWFLCCASVYHASFLSRTVVLDKLAFTDLRVFCSVSYHNIEGREIKSAYNNKRSCLSSLLTCVRCLTARWTFS